MSGHEQSARNGCRLAFVLAVALALGGCGRQAPATSETVTNPPAEPAVTMVAAPVDPADAAKAFLTSYLGDVAITVGPGKVLPVAHQERTQTAFTCSWPAGTLPAGSAAIEVDQDRGYVSLAILRWPNASPTDVTDEQLSASALERLKQWASPSVDVEQTAVQQLSDETRVAFVWDGRAGDHYSGQRAHVVLARSNGLPVSFSQYQPPAADLEPKLTEEQAVEAGTAALSPMPEDFQQTAVETRLYDHSPLSTDEGPVWAIAITGTQGADQQVVEAGAVVDAVSGEVLAPQPEAEPET